MSLTTIADERGRTMRNSLSDKSVGTYIFGGGDK